MRVVNGRRSCGQTVIFSFVEEREQRRAGGRREKGRIVTNLIMQRSATARDIGLGQGNIYIFYTLEPNTSLLHHSPLTFPLARWSN